MSEPVPIAQPIASQAPSSYIVPDPDNDNAAKIGVPFGFTGMILPWPTKTIPAGFLSCSGQVVKKSKYPELWFLLGTLWNTGGEAADEFRLPQMNDDRVIIGRASANVGTTGGASTHVHEHLSPVGMANGNPYVINLSDGQLDYVGQYDFYNIYTADRRPVSAGGIGAVEFYKVKSSAASSYPLWSGMMFIIKT